MTQYTQENRADRFSPVYINHKDYLKSASEISHIQSKETKDSKISEEAINTIIDYFNEADRMHSNFRNEILNAIKDMEFMYSNNTEKLKLIIQKHTTSSHTLSSKGMKSILDAFKGLSPNEHYYEAADFSIDSSIEKQHAYPVWIDHTIEELWFKQ
jgi:hypothetical protein